MRRMPAFTGGLVLAACLGVAGVARAASVSEGGEPPDVAGTWLNRDSTTLKDLRGHAVLIEFWATW